MKQKIKKIRFNFKKLSLTKIIVITFVLIGLIFVFSMTISQKRTLDLFVKKHDEFIDQLINVIVHSYVPIVDISDETGEDNYYTYEKKSLELKETDAYRKENAEKALVTYNEINQKQMDVFWDHIIELDTRALRFIESANKIKKREDRNAAINMSRKMRELQQNYAELYEKYLERFSVKNKVLKKIVESNGDIDLCLDVLGESIDKLLKINEEIHVIEKQAERNQREAEEMYFSLKGRLNLKSK